MDISDEFIKAVMCIIKKINERGFNNVNPLVPDHLVQYFSIPYRVMIRPVIITDQWYTFSNMSMPRLKQWHWILDVIKYLSPVNSSHKGQRPGALMFSLISVWINSYITNREAGDFRRYRAHYDVIVMTSSHGVTCGDFGKNAVSGIGENRWH